MNNMRCVASQRRVEVLRGAIKLVILSVLATPGAIYAFTPGSRILRMSQVVDKPSQAKPSGVRGEYQSRPDAITVEELKGMPFSR